MDSVFWLQIVSYVSFLFFVVTCSVKVLRYARMPIHVRWELYPVALEKGREYGGSYFEELDWWTKRRQKSLFGVLKYMGQEGLLFRECYRRNRSLWYFTYPLHIGLFLLVIFLLLLLAGALTIIAGIPVTPLASFWGRLLHYLTPVVGAALI
jgi:nitrate reductase gamma subunit